MLQELMGRQARLFTHGVLHHACLGVRAARTERADRGTTRGLGIVGTRLDAFRGGDRDHAEQLHDHGHEQEDDEATASH